MTPNSIHLIYERDHLYAQYRAGKFTDRELQLRLNALDDPEPQVGWTLATVAVLALAAMALAAVWPK